MCDRHVEDNTVDGVILKPSNRVTVFDKQYLLPIITTIIKTSVVGMDSATLKIVKMLY